MHGSRDRSLKLVARKDLWAAFRPAAGPATQRSGGPSRRRADPGREGPETMKEGIHPKYVECTVTCGCGASWTTRATVPSIAVEICSVCHPFYTGKQKFVDTAGRVEKFMRRYGMKGDSVAANKPESE